MATLLAAYSLRSRAGSFSHRQRSWDSPFGAFPSRKVSGFIITRMGPPTVSLLGAPAAVAEGRPSRPRFLGFNPSESSWLSDEGLARRSLAAPLGFRPYRVLCRKPCSGFRPNSSHALPRAGQLTALPAGASEYPSANGWIGPPASARRHLRSGQSTLLGFMHRSVPEH